MFEKLLTMVPTILSSKILFFVKEKSVDHEFRGLMFYQFFENISLNIHVMTLYMVLGNQKLIVDMEK